ncbi:MAG: CRISPR-associated helicase Cas3', partial [Burkholderiales bacterium]
AGLHLVEAPMGMGKTEAALWAAAKLVAASKSSGLYFALPTQLTSNKIHERVAAFLVNALPAESYATLALAHAASWLENPATFRIAASPAEAGDKIDSAAARTWFTSRRALLARYGVGTIDQALMAALPVKFAALRLFGLAGKVVVLDEVHTYDAYTAKLLDRLIGHLLALRCTVIVLSATLTKSRRRELLRIAAQEIPNLPDDYPLLSSCETGGTVKSVPIPYPDDLPSHDVSIRRIDLPDSSLPEPLLEEIHDCARQGQRVLVIRNTVALAQETFAALRLEGLDCGLLHSRFPFHARNGHPDPALRDMEFPDGREAKWVSRLGKFGPPRPGCILVATQVAEQSLDIDADLLITDLCPADMLLQ